MPHGNGEYTWRDGKKVNWKIEISIKENGCLIKCMGMEFIFGRMERYSKEMYFYFTKKISLKKIREKAMENWIGQMVEFIKVIGRMVNNMVMEHLFIKTK